MIEDDPSQALLAQMLARAGAGDRAAYDEAFALTYAQLKRLARSARLAVRGSTMNTTGIVHECYLRLLKSVPTVQNPAHFLAIASRAMRYLIIEQARARLTGKRGGALAHEEVDESTLAISANAQELLEIDDLLDKLAALDAQQARVVECRFFGGLSEQETAAALEISVRSVQREWARARGWMAEQV
jgi:RNA polymerase sigma factor (TIGR02999 family)